MEKNNFSLSVRANLFLYGLLFFFLLLSLRLFYLQVFCHDYYKALALRQQFRKVILPARRGDILSKDGKILARSTVVYSLYAAPIHFNHPRHIIWEKLIPLLPLSPQKVQKLRKRFFSPKYKYFLWIYRHLPASSYKKVKKLIQSQKIRGLYFQKEFRRYYPGGEFLCHVLGFTNIDGVGLEGIEKRFQKLLCGQDGYATYPVDALGRILKEEPRQMVLPRHGKSLVLTIDSRIQGVVEGELNRLVLRWSPKSACAVVMEVNTGRILALSNRPRYNPNHPARFPPEYRRNRVITDYYEPGSTMKVFTAFRAVLEGIVQWEDKFFCHYGRFQFGPRRITDTHGYGYLTVREILIRSSNIGMAQIGVKLGAEKVRQNILDFGFGQKTGIELPGESAGKITPKEKFGFYSVTSVSMGYEIGVTALQLAAAYAALVNGGKLYRPTLLEEIREGKRKIYRFKPFLVRQIYHSPKLQRQLLEVLEDVVEKGTAKSARLSDYRIGGKTGTARRSAKGKRGYTRHYLASFVAVAPISSPRIVVVVMTDSPKGAIYGGTVSAPFAARIAQGTLHCLGVPPDRNKEGKDETRKMGRFPRR